jgi:hypothetical protein
MSINKGTSITNQEACISRMEWAQSSAGKERLAEVILSSIREELLSRKFST